MEAEEEEVRGEVEGEAERVGEEDRSGLGDDRWDVKEEEELEEGKNIEAEGRGRTRGCKADVGRSINNG